VATSAQHASSERFGRSSAQRPIVLARLPRLGTPTPASPKPSMPEPMPQLDLHTEIQQQLRLHTAHPPTNARMHVPEQQTITAEEALLRERRHRSANHHETSQPRTTSAAPTGFGQRLFRLHSQLAPHAGLIVAMALIASAGLLYWMIVGAAHGPAYNDQHQPGFEDWGTTTSQMPEFSQRQFSQAPTANNTEDAWAKVPLPGLGLGPAYGPQQTKVAQPEVKPPAAESLPVTEGLVFPTTGHPHNLDFSQKGPALPSVPTVDAPQALPEVAQRPTASANH